MYRNETLSGHRSGCYMQEMPTRAAISSDGMRIACRRAGKRANPDANALFGLAHSRSWQRDAVQDAGRKAGCTRRGARGQGEGYGTPLRRGGASLQGHSPNAPLFLHVTLGPFSAMAHPLLSLLAMTKAELLDKAKETVAGRGAAYGTPTENFGRIATLWSAILGSPVTPAQVADCMIAVKLARLAQTPEHVDSVVDIAGYAACRAELLPPKET